MQQTRLTLLSMRTQFIKKFYAGFHILLLQSFHLLRLPQDVYTRNSTNENP